MEINFYLSSALNNANLAFFAKLFEKQNFAKILNELALLFRFANVISYYSIKVGDCDYVFVYTVYVYICYAYCTFVVCSVMCIILFAVMTQKYVP